MIPSIGLRLIIALAPSALTATLPLTIHIISQFQPTVKTLNRLPLITSSLTTLIEECLEVSPIFTLVSEASVSLSWCVTTELKSFLTPLILVLNCDFSFAIVSPLGLLSHLTYTIIQKGYILVKTIMHFI